MCAQKGIDEPTAAAELTAFQAKEDLFSSRLIWTCTSYCHPATWWRGNCRRSPIAQVAAAVLSMPCSTAPAERNWKLHKRQLTEKRNRLASDRLTKLVNVVENLRVSALQQKKAAHFNTLSVLDKNNTESVTIIAETWILNEFGLEDELPESDDEN
jgi:hypothetical protein